MKIGKRGLLLIGGLAVLTVFCAALYSRYWYYLPGIVQAVIDPVQPNREIFWNEGPAEAAQSPADRAPNIIVILVDDMGFNELTYGGGGLAGGTVPTPNMDSIA